MKPRQLARKLLWFLFSLIVFMIFAGLDWIPTLKDLNRLRREQRDEALKIKNFSAMTSGFIFPDAEEKSLFTENNARLCNSLPHVYDNDAWLALAMLELQAQVKAEGIANVRIYFSNHAMGSEFDKAASGRSAPLVNWLSLQYQDIQKSFQFSADPGRYLWQGVFSGFEFIRQQRLVSRPLAVALAAQLPALLDFINHISWGETRLEIVRLHLEPGPAMSRAWLLCRGNYLVRKPSAWRAVKKMSGTVADNLLIDPDSPLLWQKVSRGMMSEVFRNELPPAVPKPK
jgi:hypothetical protein